MMAVALVILVIFLFLRTFSATVIPAAAVPLSLVGTFGVMYLMGFSLNNLTLMALTISTGFVVDDAIVMIENISRYIEQGESPLQAALKGSKQIAFTILSLTVSLIAVLIPLLFMGDVVGRLFREFAVTLVHHHSHFGGCLVDVDADDVCPIVAASGEVGTGAVLSDSKQGLRPDPRAVWQKLRWVLRHQKVTLIGGSRDADSDRCAVHRDPQRLLSDSRYGRHSRISEAPQSVSVLGMETRSKRSPVPFWKIRQWKACRRSSASTVPTRLSTAAALDQSEADRGTTGQRATRSFSGCEPGLPTWKALRCIFSRCRTSPWKTVSAEPNTNTRWRAPILRN